MELVCVIKTSLYVSVKLVYIIKASATLYLHEQLQSHRLEDTLKNRCSVRTFEATDCSFDFFP
jgi:hypothetical protein